MRGVDKRAFLTDHDFYRHELNIELTQEHLLNATSSRLALLGPAHTDDALDLFEVVTVDVTAVTVAVTRVVVVLSQPRQHSSHFHCHKLAVRVSLSLFC